MKKRCHTPGQKNYLFLLLKLRPVLKEHTAILFNGVKSSVQHARLESQRLQRDERRLIFKAHMLQNCMVLELQPIISVPWQRETNSGRKRMGKGKRKRN